MAAVLLPEGKQSYETAAGIPLVGGKLYTFDAGTSNPRQTTSDAAGLVPNTNPIILDARGEATVFWTGAYKVRLEDALANVIWTQDNVSTFSGSNSVLDNYSADSGVVNAYVAAAAAAVNGYVVGLRVAVKINTTNTGPSTLNYVGLGAKTITLQNGATLGGREMAGGGIYEFEYDGTNFQLLNPAVFEPQTVAEAAVPLTPTFFTYRTTPKIDPRRYLTSTWDSGGLQTTGLQNAINRTYAIKGRLILPNGLDVTSGALTLTMPGNRATQGFAVEGPGWNGARITQVGAPTALLTIAGSTPASNPSEAPIVLEGFSLVGLSGAAHGILLNGVGYWRLSGVQVRNFNAGIYLKSALLGVINDNCMSNENQYGLLAERDGALPFPAGGSGCNRLTVSDSIFNLNSTFGLFLQSGTNWALSNLDIESNGTVGNINTGGIRLTGLLDDDIGVAQVACRSLWMEANKGTPFLVDACPGLILSIRDTLMLNSGVGTMELWVLGADRVSIEDTMAPAGGGGIWDITATYLSLKNTLVGTLTDSGVTYPSYRNASTSTGTYISGKTDSFTATITGMTGSVTGTAFTQKDGDRVRIILPPLLGTSNATTMTITGMPAYLRPLATRDGGIVQIRDNSLDSAATTSVSAAGVVTLNRMDSAAFNVAGSKGLLTGSLSYRITA